MPRFYVAGLPPVGAELDLPDNVVRHLNVLRIRENEEIVLFDGGGCAYPAQLTLLEKRRARARILREMCADGTPPLDIMLVQAVSSGERMDFTVQKSVELGVGRIWPVISGRCVVRLEGERAKRRVARWQEIAVSACEQCGRNVVPPVLPLTGFDDMLAKLPEGRTRLMMSPQGAQKLGGIRPLSDGIILLIGPEGGLMAEEEAKAAAAGFVPLVLGGRVLRTETASLAALAAMQTLWGDFA